MLCPRISVTALLAVCGLLAACSNHPSHNPGTSSASTAPAAPAVTATELNQPAAPPSVEYCDASKVQWTLGQIADQALQDKARAEAGAKWVRVLDPNTITTLEYNDFRLNLRVDENRRVDMAVCG